MTTLYEGAFAKINLTLDVLGKREDGYHDLKSVMQTISIRDDVEIDIGTGKPWTLECSNPEIPADATNLAWKAAQVYCDAMNKDPDGIAIRITKRIPSGAGLGGGSADAAAVLRALNRHYGEPLSVFALAELGETDFALDIIREYWGAMLDLGATTFWEDFDIKWGENAYRIDELPQKGKNDAHGDFGKFCYKQLRHSLCHGWASGPTSFLSRHILGIKPIEPGYKKIKIESHLGELAYAEGKIPTPYGEIMVRHEKNDKDIKTDINIPDGVEIIK